MNLDKWNSLSKELKQIVEEVSTEWVDVHGAAWDKSDDEGRAYTISQGNEIIPLSEEENQRWAEAVRPIIEDYVRTTEDKGLPGEKAAALAKALIAKHSK